MHEQAGAELGQAQNIEMVNMSWTYENWGSPIKILSISCGWVVPSSSLVS